MKGPWLGCVVSLTCWLGTALPAAAIDKDEAARKIAEAYDVQVLKVAESEIDGQPVWLVTLMKGGGDRNDAFLVTTLAVDRESGELVPSFRHLESGYELPPRPGGGDTDALRPDAMRSGVWR